MKVLRVRQVHNGLARLTYHDRDFPTVRIVLPNLAVEARITDKNAWQWVLRFWDEYTGDDLADDKAESDNGEARRYSGEAGLTARMRYWLKEGVIKEAAFTLEGDRIDEMYPIWVKHRDRWVSLAESGIH
jgi:hypothetical protein